MYLAVSEDLRRTTYRLPISAITLGIEPTAVLDLGVLLRGGNMPTVTEFLERPEPNF